MNAEALEYVDPGTAFSLAGALYLLLTIIAAIHILLNKQNEAAAFSWLGIVVLAPLLGAIIYWLFGINRIKRRAQAEFPDYPFAAPLNTSSDGAVVQDTLPSHWQSLMQQGLGIHPFGYLLGNGINPLINGNEAYPKMLDAMATAQRSIVLSSYIFEYDQVGSQFVDALVAAHQRGVAVRVLIDGVGVGYGFSLVRADRVLRRKGIKTARFLSTLSTTGTRFINLRNHRKIVSVDGVVAFVGGMNIREGNLIIDAGLSGKKNLTQDVHFEISGPVINQINTVFAADWKFATGEALSLPLWRKEAGSAGDVVSRVLIDGPDDNYQKLELTLLSAIHAAKERVCIVSPYFLPGITLRSALQLAVLRGVKVTLCVPEKNNLPFVGWAMRANYQKLISHGIEIYESPPPFDHSKLFLVDDYWSMIGSSNWDARSLALNFEINLECYDKDLNEQIGVIISKKQQNSRQVLQNDYEQFLQQLRNKFFRLFSPYF